MNRDGSGTPWKTPDLLHFPPEVKLVERCGEVLKVRGTPEGDSLISVNDIAKAILSLRDRGPGINIVVSEM